MGKIVKKDEEGWQATSHGVAEATVKEVWDTARWQPQGVEKVLERKAWMQNPALAVISEEWRGARGATVRTDGGRVKRYFGALVSRTGVMEHPAPLPLSLILTLNPTLNPTQAVGLLRGKKSNAGDTLFTVHPLGPQGKIIRSSARPPNIAPYRLLASLWDPSGAAPSPSRHRCLAAPFQLLFIAAAAAALQITHGAAGCRHLEAPQRIVGNASWSGSPPRSKGS